MGNTYRPDTIDGKYYYVPIVVKNKDSLIATIEGIKTGYEMMEPICSAIGVEFDTLPELNSYDADGLGLGSDRFVDVLPGGYVESKMNAVEKKDYLDALVKSAYDKAMCDDSDVKMNCVLLVSCECDFGHYSWASYKEIPSETFRCVECGRKVIDYTGVDDWEYDFNELYTTSASKGA